MKVTQGSLAATTFNLRSLLPSPVVRIAIAVVEKLEKGLLCHPDRLDSQSFVTISRPARVKMIAPMYTIVALPHCRYWTSNGRPSERRSVLDAAATVNWVSWIYPLDSIHHGIVWSKSWCLLLR